MTISKKELYSLIFVLFLIALLPLVVYFVGRNKGFDIRPKAVLSGASNFILTPDTTSLNTGQRVSVLVGAELTDATVRMSGVNFMLLYDKDRYNLISVAPVLGNNFTETVLLDDRNLPYAGEGGGFNYMRLAMTAKKNSSNLPTGTVALANVTFEAKLGGQAVIKLPEDNSKLQVVGISL